MILGVGPRNFWIPVSDGFLDPETSQKHFSLHKKGFKAYDKNFFKVDDGLEDFIKYFKNEVSSPLL